MLARRLEQAPSKGLIGQPHDLIRCQLHMTFGIFNWLPRHDVMPGFGRDQVEVTQGEIHRFVTQVIQAEDALIASLTLTPEAKHLMP